MDCAARPARETFRQLMLRRAGRSFPKAPSIDEAFLKSIFFLESLYLLCPLISILKSVEKRMGACNKPCGSCRIAVTAPAGSLVWPRSCSAARGLVGLVSGGAALFQEFDGGQETVRG